MLTNSTPYDRLNWKIAVFCHIPLFSDISFNALLFPAAEMIFRKNIKNFPEESGCLISTVRNNQVLKIKEKGKKA